jgi:hypothetical protein
LGWLLCCPLWRAGCVILKCVCVCVWVPVRE